MPGELMRFRPLVLVLAISLALFPSVSLPQAFAASVVHGSVYDWSTFNTVNTAEVTVNSTPQQVMVSKGGSYSFNLDKGTYSIVARTEGSGPDALMAMENVTISQDSGDYVIDLILFPSGNYSDLGVFNENVSAIPTDEPVDAAAVESQQSWIWIILPAIVVIALCVGAGSYMLLRRRKKRALAPGPEKAAGQILPEAMPPEQEAMEEPEEPKMPPLAPVESTDVTLPDDLREVIRIIEKSGGRITQLDLRKALPYSEAKVSLMVTDLESRGIVKKIKKGRGNVIILNRPGTGAETE